MAGEVVTTASTLSGFIASAAVSPTAADYARPSMVMTPLMLRMPAATGSLTTTIPRFAAPVAANDHGASADTEFSGAEADNLSPTAISSDSATATLAEWAHYTTVGDLIKETSPFGADLLSSIISVQATAVQTGVEVDALALMSGLTNNVGTTTTPMTIANAFAASDGVRDDGFGAPEGLAYVLGTEQAKNLRDSCVATGASGAIYEGPAATLLGVEAASNLEIASGLRFFFNRTPVFVSGLVPTANAGADEVGACFVPGFGQNAGHATFVYLYTGRTMRVEVVRSAEGRADKVVLSHVASVARSSDDSGYKITTDAG
jgi:hypothetical protein